MIDRHIDISLNGPWTCFHGTKRDKAVANITVLNTGKVR